MNLITNLEVDKVATKTILKYNLIIIRNIEFVGGVNFAFYDIDIYRAFSKSIAAFRKQQKY